MPSFAPQSPVYWIETLQLLPHPEGGYYRQSYHSTDILTALPDRYDGPRAAGSAIHFMVTGAAFSAFHSLQTDEIWHYYTGTHPLQLHIIAPDGRYQRQLLGPDPSQGECFQFCMPHSHWFAAEVADPQGFALMGCTLAPAFDFADFEMAERVKLTHRFPQHAALIARLTRLATD